MKFLIFIIFFLISCSGSGSSNPDLDNTQESTVSSSNFVNFNCSAYSSNIDYCQISQNSLIREIYLYKPSNISSLSEVPVLFSFHGGGGTALGNFSYTGFNEIADSEKFYVIYHFGLYYFYL